MSNKGAIAKLRRDKEATFEQYLRCIKIISDEAEKLAKRSTEHHREMSITDGYEYYSANENKIEQEATSLRFLSYKLATQCDMIRELEGFDTSFIKIEELWQWDGRYIKGKKLKRSKTKQTVMNHAKKHMEYDRIVKGGKKGEFFFEDKEGRPVGMLIERQDAKETKK